MKQLMKPLALAATMTLSFVTVNSCGGDSKKKNQQKPNTSAPSPNEVVGVGPPAFGSPRPDDTPIAFDALAERGAWRAISNDGAPRARYNHKAFWTGTEMVIFGGRMTKAEAKTATNSTVFTDLSDGGIYNLASDVWRTIPETSLLTSELFAYKNGELIFADKAGNEVTLLNLQTFETESFTAAEQSQANGFAQMPRAVVGDELVFWNFKEPEALKVFNLATKEWSKLGPGNPEFLVTRAKEEALRNSEISVFASGTSLFLLVSFHGNERQIELHELDMASESATWRAGAVISADNKCGALSAAAGSPLEGEFFAHAAGATIDERRDASRTRRMEHCVMRFDARSQSMTQSKSFTSSLEDLNTFRADQWVMFEASHFLGGRATEEHTLLWGFQRLYGRWQKAKVNGNQIDLEMQEQYLWTHNEGLLWDHGSDEWFRTASTGAPAGRHLHSTIWTGESYIVWGGRSFEAYDVVGSDDQDTLVDASLAEGAVFIP